MLVLLIVACEIGFWVLALAGLAARYVLRMRRLSTGLLLLVPLLDVVLVSASLLDVAQGNPPRWSHGLAALYLGFTVVFGHSVIQWADRKVARRYGGVAVAPKPERYGMGAALDEWREWAKLLLVCGVTLGVLWLTAQVAGTPIPAPLDWFSDPLWSWGARLLPVLIVWFVGWPLWATLWPSTPPRNPAPERAEGAQDDGLEHLLGKQR